MAQPTGITPLAARLWRERKLHELRLGRDIENLEIARVLDVDPATVGRWFKGQARPSDDDLAELVRYFSPTLGLLRYGEGAQPDMAGAGLESAERAAEPPVIRPPVKSDARRGKRAGGRHPQ